jgi:hypothetical protein
MEHEVRVVPFVKQNLSLVAIVSVIAAVLSVGVAVRASGMRPFGEDAISGQINREDAALCEKFGFLAKTPQYADCMLALVDLRQRHVDLLISYSWL